MKAFIDRDGCIACEFCPSACPEVFKMAKYGLAEVYVDEVLKNVENKAKEAYIFYQFLYAITVNMPPVGLVKLLLIWCGI